MSGYIVIGTGKAGTWSNDASAIERTETDLIAAATKGELYERGQKKGLCDRDGNMLGEAWLVVVGDHVPVSTLDRDPAVWWYCSAP